MAGSAGCNRYMASYTVEGDTVALGPTAVTRKMCALPGVMEQEQGYLTALESARTYRINGDELDLVDADVALDLAEAHVDRPVDPAPAA